MKSSFKSKEEIKQDVSVLDYALLHGYLIDKEKSTKNWVKLDNPHTGDRILVKPKMNLYYNMDYKNDKGDVLQFVCNRLQGSLNIDHSNEAFYKSMVYINEFLGNTLPDKKNILADKDKFFAKKEKLTQIQSNEKTWNHTPITDYSYFTNVRGISLETLKSPLFEERLFNTYFRLPSNHLITNYAFGKFANNELVGLEVRNNTVKTILGDHDGVFYTNTKNMSTIDGVFYGESGIDVASYIEILNNNPQFDSSKNYCFLSFSGNLYESKLSGIINDLSQMPLSSTTKFVSITDNDFDKPQEKRPGKNYDVMFTAALINKEITPVAFSSNDQYYVLNFNQIPMSLLVNLQSVVIEQNKKIAAADEFTNQSDVFLKLTQIEIQTTSLEIPKKLSLEDAEFKNILHALNAQRLFISHKPKEANDWNEELQKRKGVLVSEKKKEKIVPPKETAKGLIPSKKNHLKL